MDEQRTLQPAARRWLERARHRPLLTVALLGVGGLMLADALGAAEVAVAAGLAYAAYRALKPAQPQPPVATP